MQSLTKLLYTCEKSSQLLRASIDLTLLPIAMEDRVLRSAFVERVKTEYPKFAEEMPGNWRIAIRISPPSLRWPNLALPQQRM